MVKITDLTCKPQNVIAKDAGCWKTSKYKQINVKLRVKGIY